MQKFRVYFGTGTAFLHSVDVEAFHEQEAVDIAVDKLEEEESAILMEYYEVLDLCETGQTVDEFAEYHGLTVAGNSGLYCVVNRIEK